MTVPTREFTFPSRLESSAGTSLSPAGGRLALPGEHGPLPSRPATAGLPGRSRWASLLFKTHPSLLPRPFTPARALLILDERALRSCLHSEEDHSCECLIRSVVTDVRLWPLSSFCLSPRHCRRSSTTTRGTSLASPSMPPVLFDRRSSNPSRPPFARNGSRHLSASDSPKISPATPTAVRSLSSPSKQPSLPRSSREPNCRTTSGTSPACSGSTTSLLILKGGIWSLPARLKDSLPIPGEPCGD